MGSVEHLVDTMLHPQMVADMLASPTRTPGHVDPIPTVRPTPPKFEHASDAGHVVLWVVFAIMLASSVLFAGLAWHVPVSKRLFHFLTTTITVIATLSYYAMATGSGYSMLASVDHHHHKHVPDEPYLVFRQVFWARYIDWLLTTPLLLLNLSLLSGLNGANTVVGLLANVIMVLTGQFFAFSRASGGQKWGWFAMACVAYLVVIWTIGVQGARAAKVRGGNVPKTFSSLAGFLFVVWTAYPIIWGVAEGAHVLSVDGGIIAYAILDFLAKPVFGLWLLLSHRRVPETHVEINGWWAHGPSTEGRIRLTTGDGA